MHKPRIDLLASMAMIGLLLAGCRDAAETRAPIPPLPSQPPSAAGHWQCGEQRIEVTTGTVPAGILVEHAGGQLQLAAKAGTSGTEYADTRGNGFNRQQDRASLTLAGQPAMECAPSDTPSPWQQAQSRGAVFRAVGTEPFWSLEISAGDPPVLDAQLDAGQRRLSARLRRDSAGRYSGRVDNTPISIGIDRQPCSDGMSDVVYQARVRLRLGDHDYRGCGRYLGQ